MSGRGSGGCGGDGGERGRGWMAGSTAILSTWNASDRWRAMAGQRWEPKRGGGWSRDGPNCRCQMAPVYTVRLLEICADEKKTYLAKSLGVHDDPSVRRSSTHVCDQPGIGFISSGAIDDGLRPSLPSSRGHRRVRFQAVSRDGRLHMKYHQRHLCIL